MAPYKPRKKISNNDKNPNDTPLGKPRKGPPKFQHLPLAQAQKLKKAWIDTKKIKSAYKAEKRKAGNGPSIPRRLDTAGGNERGSRDEVMGSDAEVGEKDDESEDKISRSPPPIPRKQLSPSPRTRVTSRSKPLKSSLPTSKPAPQSKPTEDEIEQAQRLELRNLTREAYSKDSLHNFKSDPLGRRRKQGQQNTSRGGHNGRHGNGDPQGKGKGQPDMKKRMGVLLARLQLDAARRP